MDILCKNFLNAWQPEKKIFNQQTSKTSPFKINLDFIIHKNLHVMLIKEILYEVLFIF